MLAMYLLGIVVALLMAWLFKKTLLKGETPLLIMELPPYKRPLLKVVLRHMWDRSKLFLRRAGTVILGINILLWFLATYPRDTTSDQVFARHRAEHSGAGRNWDGREGQLDALDNNRRVKSCVAALRGVWVASSNPRSRLSGLTGRWVSGSSRASPLVRFS